MNLTLTAVKTEHHYDLTDAPDVRHLLLPITIRPAQIVIHSTEGNDAIVVVIGPQVRRNGTLGVKRAATFSQMDHQHGREIPDWLNEIVLDAGLSWKTSGGQR